MSVSGVYLFGSSARGDADSASDTDVLIMYETDVSDSIRAHAKACITATLSAQCAFAEYSRRRLAAMFREGHLFAWHLFQEAKPLQVVGLPINPSSKFERPQPYTEAVRDAANFYRLLRSCAEHLERVSLSLAYEAGLAYVALRNIGMSLSAALLPQPVFTRWAPFDVARGMQTPPPCPLEAYEVLVAARHASQRGLDTPTLDREMLLEQLRSACSWATSSIEIANGKITV
jgi:hypothetical protein